MRAVPALSALALAGAALLAPATSAYAAGPTCDGQRATIVAGRHQHRIQGTEHRDVIVAGPGNDRILGNGGDDLICAGPGTDTVVGGAGDDVVLAGSPGRKGPDRVVADPGDDRVVGELEGTVLSFARAQHPVTVDLARGFAEARGLGRDTLVRVGTVRGSTHDDTLLGSRRADLLFGGGGADLLRGQQGMDLLAPGSGADRVSGGRGGDFAMGGRGDLVRGDRGADFLFGRGDVLLSGGNGEDYLLTFGGHPVVRGGHGLDAFTMEEEDSGIEVDLGNGVAGNGRSIVSLTGIEVALGSVGDDTLTGSGRRDYLAGDIGADTLSGLGGDDYLEGGDGMDTLDGGDGTDTCAEEEDVQVNCESASGPLPRAQRQSGRMARLTAQVGRGGPSLADLLRLWRR